MKAEIFDSLTTVPYFSLYFLVALGLLFLFTTVYIYITPYREITLIRSGNTAAAISLGGSLLGFVLAISFVIVHSVSLIDLMIWGLIALSIQIIAYFTVCFIIKDINQSIEKGCIAHATFLAICSICLGILNGVCMTP